MILAMREVMSIAGDAFVEMRYIRTAVGGTRRGRRPRRPVNPAYRRAGACSRRGAARRYEHRLRFGVDRRLYTCIQFWTKLMFLCKNDGF